MLVAVGAGKATLEGERNTGISDWKLLPPEQALARLADEGRRSETASSSDGFSHPVCLAAAARAATREGSTILVAEGHHEARRMLLPLRIERNLGIRLVVPLSAPLSQYAPAPGGPVSAKSLRGLINALKAGRCGDLLLLRRMREDNPLREALDEIGALPSQQSVAPFLDLAAFPDFDTYNETFSPKVLRDRRRKLRRLEELGPVEFEVLPGGLGEKDLRQALEWKRDWLGHYGIASPVFDGAHWERALLECARAEHAFLSVLRIAGAPVAVELGFVDGDTYLAYLGAFDPEYGKLSTGQEQMSRTIAWCFQKGLSRYDLQPPEDDYKLRWTRDGTAVRVADYTVPLTAAGRAASFVHRRLRPLVKQLVLSTPAGLRRLLAPAAKAPGRARIGIWPAIALMLALLDPALAG